MKEPDEGVLLALEHQAHPDRRQPGGNMPFHGLRFTLPALLLAASLSAQRAPGPRVSTQYWLTAGAGYGYLANNSWPLGRSGSSAAFAASIQHGIFVSSVRWAGSRTEGQSGWDMGLLAGLGSPSRYAVRGSIGAGLGLARDYRGNSAVTVPLELQLGWRLTSSVGVGTYAFGNLGGPSEALGVAAALQIGKLK